MTEQLTPLCWYNNRIRVLSTQLSAFIQKRKMLAWARFISIILSVGCLWQLWSVNLIVAFILSGIFLIIFFVIVLRDLKNSDAIRNTELLIKINEQELLVLQHHFINLPDGLQYKPAEHDYANDLDIFGKASLFQYVNRTTGEQAGTLLSDWLLLPASSEEIIKRQQAVKELSSKPEWRQQLQATGTENKITIQTEKNIGIWLKEDKKFSTRIWKAIRIIYPAIALTILVLFVTEYIPLSLFTLLLVVFFALSGSVSKMIMPAYIQLTKITGEIETLSDSIHHIEKENFSSEKLQQLQHSLENNSVKASGIIRKLKSILDRFDMRLNIIVFIPLNTFLLWDLQQILLLEKWKSENKNQVNTWYRNLAEIESLSALGNLSFNHPQWCFPVLDNNKGVFITREMGHPLIPKDKIVNNAFSTDGVGKINLVTGSNMAGKSTFLRSIGVNTVLAMMGAPVCAKELRLHPTKIISTMRVNDNLEESTSTFYAELKKLKTIIEAVNRGENVFLLLDEILRGTNSLDRHTGSEALLKQLIKNNAVGLIATHDLELAKMINTYPSNIINYHFDVQVNNEELYFDYKLKTGICQSMNASLLMKKIGIELGN